MKVTRRTLLGTIAACLSAGSAFKASAEGDWPSRVVRLVSPYGAGGASDISLRILAEQFGRSLNQQFIVENKPGAGGNIAAESVARAPADGYTLLVIGANNPINSTLYEKLSFDLLRDFAPVAGIYRVYQVMDVNPSFPAKTVAEFIAYAKAHPGKVNFGSAGTGSVAHVSGEYFKMLAGVDMQHVPYRGAPLALADLLSGQVQVMFDNLPSSVGHIKGGKLRALAVTSEQREPSMPQVPAVGETVAGYEATAWFGIGMPKGTPREIIDKVNAEVNRALADPAMRARLAELGGKPMPGTPEAFGKVIASETAKWGKVVTSSGAKVE